MSLTLFLVCFFKQKTAYEMRISDWSSDVCSSDLMKDDEWDQVIRVNLEAAFRLARAATRPMLKARFGRIISITSVVGQTGNPGQVNYAASKAGLVGMTKALAQELASRSEEHTSELQSLMRISYAVFCLTKTKTHDHDA